MSRRLRFIPDHGALVEVTCRALHSRFLFRPGPMLNPIILGALARAKSLYPVRICAFAFLSNHFHLILEVDDARQLARFMGHFNSKLAREVGRLTGWREKIFGRRYQAILISSEHQAQAERLRYVLSQDYASYCTSFGLVSSATWGSSWYRKSPWATQCERTRPSVTHW